MKNGIRVAGPAYLLALVVLGTGMAVSASTGDWQWFSRSGSLVVVVGIMLTSHQIFENLGQLRSRRDANRKQSAMHDWAKGDPRLDITRDPEEEAWATESSGFLLLVVGTLVWGLGDLLGFLF